MLSYAKFKGVTALENAAQNNPWLKWGHRGAHIATLQRALVDLGHKMPKSTKANNTLDGIYGGEMHAVVKAFQSGVTPPIKVDGIVGKNTMAALDAAMVKKTKPKGPTKITFPAKVVTVKPPKTVKFLDDNKFDLHLKKLSGGYVCLLTMSLKFVFKDGDSASWTNTAEKRAYMTGWKNAVENKWSLSNLHTSPTFGTVPFDVVINASMGKGGSSEWTMTVTKIPAGGFAGSSVWDGPFSWNTSVADSGDLNPVQKGATMGQRASVHEFGHMIGLPDEYPESAIWGLQWSVANQHDTDSIMHSGERLRARHHKQFRDWVKAYFGE